MHARSASQELCDALHRYTSYPLSDERFHALRPERPADHGRQSTRTWMPNPVVKLCPPELCAGAVIGSTIQMRAVLGNRIASGGSQDDQESMDV